MGRRNFMHSLIVLVSISTYYSHLFFCIIRTVNGIFIAKRYFVNVCTAINLHHTNRLVWCRIGTFFTFPLVSAPIFALRFSNHPHRYTLLIPFRMHKLNKIKRSESNLFIVDRKVSLPRAFDVKIPFFGFLVRWTCLLLEKICLHFFSARLSKNHVILFFAKSQLVRGPNTLFFYDLYKHTGRDFIDDITYLDP